MAGKLLDGTMFYLVFLEIFAILSPKLGINEMFLNFILHNI